MPAKSRTSDTMSKKGKSSAKKVVAPKTAKGDRRPAITTSAKANLIMPVSRIMGLMRRDRLNTRISKSGAIMMAGLLEYLTGELCEMAGNFALEKKKKRLTNRFIQLAISSDDEFSKMLTHAIIFKGGVLPHIEPALMPKKKGAMEPMSQANAFNASQEV